MAHRPNRRGGLIEQRTPEITGADASYDEADIGSVWNGDESGDVSLDGQESGLPIPMESAPDRPEDIVPDAISTRP